MNTTLKTFAFSIFCFLIAACGGQGDQQQKAEPKEQEPKAQKEEKAPAEQKEKKVVEITVKATGNTIPTISYDPKTLTIPANSRVKLTLINESTEKAMHHNWVLIDMGTGDEVSKQGIEAGEDAQYVPDNEHVITYTDMLKPQTETTIEFDAPPVGSYHYICTYPGHYPNMVGRLEVEASS